MKSQEHFDHNNVAPAKIQIGFWHQLIAFIFYPRHAINVVNDLQNELQVEIKITIVSITYNGNDIVLFFNTIECTKEGIFLTSLTFMIIFTFSRIDSRHKLYKIVPQFQLTFALSITNNKLPQSVLSIVLINSVTDHLLFIVLFADYYG